jgi:hypothetical protein
MKDFWNRLKQRALYLWRLIFAEKVEPEKDDYETL